MRRPPYALFILTLLLIGTGCALSSADTSRNVSAVTAPAPTPSSAAVVGVDPRLSPIAPPDGATGDGGPLETSPVVDATVAAEPAVAVVPRNFTLKSGDFFFDPASITVKSGETFTLTISDTFSGHHTFNIDEINLHESLSPGQVLSLTAPVAPGRYAYYCDIGPHRTLGMEGLLIVE